MHRFFIEKENITNNIVTISGNDFNHLAHSLRLNPGDKIIACTGDGNDLIVKLKEFEKDCVKGNIIDKRKSNTEPKINITLGQAIPKNRNMELVIQKSTEIGVRNIIPLYTERTVVKLKGKKKKKRLHRWQRIAQEAAKQSQRGIIPKIKDLRTLKSLITDIEHYDHVFVFWTDNKTLSLREVLPNSLREKNILLLIGPEGGFTSEEIDLIKKDYRGTALSLGPRILRTETAGLVSLSLLLHEAGELE